VSAAQWWVLLGAFVGGAIPWLEAIIVIPAGILAGGPPVAVVALAVIGNLLTVWLTAVFGERLRAWWGRRRAARRADAASSAAASSAASDAGEGGGAGEGDPGQGDAGQGDAGQGGDDQRSRRRAGRIKSVMTRWGMPGLAVLGPLGLGTQLLALAAVAAGVSSRVAFAWVGAGTVAWSVVAAVLTTAGASFFGVGA